MRGKSAPPLPPTPTAPLAAHVEAALARRIAAGERYFAAEAPRLARLCHRMAERFARGGRLVAVGCSPAARSDVRHVAGAYHVLRELVEEGSG